MFNFGIVVPDKFDTKPYEAVVRRLADTFREMEIQNQYLSMEGQCGGKGIGALLEIIREDLNNYNECMIPVGKFTIFASCGFSLTETRQCNNYKHQTLSSPTRPAGRQSMARSTSTHRSQRHNG